jgi:hypothetical protein
VSIGDTPEGFVVSHHVYQGNPADADTLETSVVGAKSTGMSVRTVFADRGYGNEVADGVLDRLGIRDRVARRDRAAPVEAAPLGDVATAGGPEPRVGSVTSSAGTDWPGPVSRGSPEPPSGSATGSSATTWTGWWLSPDVMKERDLRSP